MVTRKNDHDRDAEEHVLSDVCNLVLKGLIWAENHNVTQHNAREKLPAIHFVLALETVGNYGEIYARRMEQVSSRDLSQGLSVPCHLSDNK